MENNTENCNTNVYFYVLIGVLVVYLIIRQFVFNETDNENFDASLVPVSSVVTLAKVAQKLVDGNGTLTNPGNLTVTGALTAGGTIISQSNAGPFLKQNGTAPKDQLFFWNNGDGQLIIIGNTGTDYTWGQEVGINGKTSTISCNNIVSGPVGGTSTGNINIKSNITAPGKKLQISNATVPNADGQITADSIANNIMYNGILYNRGDATINGNVQIDGAINIGKTYGLPVAKNIDTSSINVSTIASKATQDVNGGWLNWPLTLISSNANIYLGKTDSPNTVRFGGGTHIDTSGNLILGNNCYIKFKTTGVDSTGPGGGYLLAYSGKDGTNHPEIVNPNINQKFTDRVGILHYYDDKSIYSDESKTIHTTNPRTAAANVMINNNF